MKNTETILTESRVNTEKTEEDVVIDERWSELKITGSNLSGRSYHSLVYDKGYITSYGGYEIDRGVVDDFYQMKIEESESFVWKKVILNKENEVLPGQLRRHSAVIYNDKMYVFGGQHLTTQNNNKLFSFDLVKQKWEFIENQGDYPPPIDSHNSVIYQNSANQTFMLVFGGYLGGKHACDTNSIYSLDLETKNWECLFQLTNEKQFPKPRNSSGCVLFQNALYIFGGVNTATNQKFDDVWKFDLNSKKWQKIAIAGYILPEVNQSINTFLQNRYGHSMVQFKNYIFLFGGIKDVTKEKNDVYALDLNTNKWINYQQNQSSTITKLPNFKKNPSSLKTENNNDNIITLTNPNADTQKLKNKNKCHTEISSSKFDKMVSVSTMMRNPGDKKEEQHETTNFQEEKIKQKQSDLKAKMLKDIHEIDLVPDHRNKNNSSPTSEAIKNSIFRLGQQKKKGDKTEVSSIENSQSIRFKFENNLLIGKKPCERNGQASCILNNKLLIFGGDRHLFSFGDIYFFDLDIALEKGPQL